MEGSLAYRPHPMLVALTALAVGSAALYLVTYPPGGAPSEASSIGVRILTYPLLFAFYFASIYIVFRERDHLPDRCVTALVVISSVIFRLIVLNGPVAWNDDTWRYLWEGRVVLAGLNPYAAPPDDPVYDPLRKKLAEARDPLFDNLPKPLNHVRSVYGPLATALFVIPHLISADRVRAMRVLTTLFDVATIPVLLLTLKAMGRPRAAVVIYAWNPVCLSGFADRAQIDAPMTFFVALAAWLAVTHRHGQAGLAFAAAVLIKLSPIWLALPFARMGRARFAWPLAVTLAIGSLPFVAAGPSSLSGFRDFSLYWRNTDSLFTLLLFVLQPLRPLASPDITARVVATAALPLYAAWRCVRAERSDTEWLLRTSAAIVTASILLSPVVHPWYTVHLLIFLVFAPSPGMLLLTASTMSWFMRFWRPTDPIGTWLTTHLGGKTDLWRWIGYAPVYVSLVAEYLRSRGATLYSMRKLSIQ